MPDFGESIVIDAPGDQLYALVSDLPRMGEWSPECTRVSWTGGATGAVVGSRFIGHNRAGAIRWFTQGEVLEAEPGRRFAFQIHLGPVPIALWEYEFTPAATGGCTVAESWSDRRPTALRLTIGRIFGDRNKRNAKGIRTTLANLKTAAESTRQTR
jgi:uncharacterized protein YndB with AHSA1/START domain